MSVFKDNYTSFLKDMEENIKNKEDLEYIKKRFEQLYNTICNIAFLQISTGASAS